MALTGPYNRFEAVMVEIADSGRKMLAALKLAVRDAWRVLSLCPDPDKRFRGSLSGAWCFPVVHDSRDAYGAAEVFSVARATPQDITRMEIVMEWMAWIRRLAPQQGGGDFAVKRIMGWSLGTPIWVMAQRERCSERSIERRVDKSLSAVLAEFLAVTVELDTVDEPLERADRIRGFTDRPITSESCELEPGKVFIDGIGFMFHGKRYNDGGKLLDRGRIRDRSRSS